MQELVRVLRALVNGLRLWRLREPHVREPHVREPHVREPMSRYELGLWRRDCDVLTFVNQHSHHAPIENQFGFVTQNENPRNS